MALEENKITQKEFVIYTYSFLYFALSAAMFSTIFAVQPDPGNPDTIMIHTLPFTNLIIALTVLQIAVTWFGRTVSWKGLKHKNKLTKRFLRLCTYICLGTLILTTILKVIHQINALADLKNPESIGTKKENGLWFNVHNHKPTSTHRQNLVTGSIGRPNDAKWIPQIQNLPCASHHIHRERQPTS